jgi:putative endonuclease
MDNWLVYLLRSEKDGSLYCGSTNDVEKRLVAHNAGKGGGFTRSRRPWVVAMTIPCASKSDALKLEYKIKQMK